ncbi:MAG: serine hydrolase domain-containing protein [Candidatus Zhuqueibacterota bacterium]
MFNSANKIILISTLFIVLFAIQVSFSTPQNTDFPTPEDLTEILSPILKKHNVPALAAAFVLDGKIVGAGAVGVRKVGSDVNVTLDDAFDIGSCTKAMTATVLGILVEQGKLRWDETLDQALPDLADEMHIDCKKITIEQLLTHRAGLPTYGGELPAGKTIGDLYTMPGTPREQRKLYTRLMLKQPPEITPGERYSYSNVGYSIAGTIAEEILDLPWEILIDSLLFKPLGMTTADYELRGSPEKIEMPWQHAFEAGQRIPIDPTVPNPIVIRPAGDARCSVQDWAKFVIAHLNGDAGRPTPLQLKDFKTLHTPSAGSDYAMGWMAADRQWGGGRVFWHSGSNNLNYAVVWIAPLKNMAVVVVTNQGGEIAYQACDETAGALIQHYRFRAATLLDNLNWSPKWLAWMGCVKGCLDYLKMNVSDAWLYGATGYAFLLNVHERVLSSSVGGWSRDRLYELGENIGFRTERIVGEKDKPDFAEQQKLAWEKVRAAIDNGVPCIGYPLHYIPEDYVIFGYDETGYNYKGVDVESGEGPVAWQTLGRQDGYFQVKILRPIEPANDAKTIKDALQFVLDFSKEKNEWISPECTAGPAGYDVWIKALQGKKADAFGAAFIPPVWAECRSYAVQFLDEAKGRLSPELGDLFEEAKIQYRVSAENLKQVSEVFPCFSVSEQQREVNVKDDRKIAQAVECLKQAREADKAGLVVLEKIVEKLSRESAK